MSSPNGIVPAGAQGLGTLEALRSYDAAHVRSTVNQPLLDSFEGSFWGNLIATVGGWIEKGIETISRIIGQIIDIFNGLIITPINNLIQGVKDFFTGNWLPGRGGVTEALHDAQLDLSERTELLSPLLDYGSAYMDTSGGFANAGQAWFVHPVGPMQNCHIANGRIVLEEKGLWDIRASMWFDATGLGGGVGWNVRVLTPSGAIFSEKMEYFDDKSAKSDLSISSVVVPGSGYQVQVYVTVIAVGRGIIGGVSRNRLTVQHISRDTTTGDTGQG